VSLGLGLSVSGYLLPVCESQCVYVCECVDFSLVRMTVSVSLYVCVSWVYSGVFAMPVCMYMCVCEGECVRVLL
jgi:hypothetical protein